MPCWELAICRIRAASKGLISAKTVMLLLAALVEKSGEAEPRHLCNALLGVGYLSNQGCLKGAVSARTVMLLLAMLAEKSDEAKPVDFCNALLGVGYLSNQGCLEGAVSAKTVMLLLAALVEKSGEAEPQGLCNALLGVGYLSNQGCLKGAVSAKTVMPLLVALAEKSRKAEPQHLCNALLGVGYLSNQDCLEGAVSAKTVMLLLAALVEKSGEAEPRHLCNALLGVGYLSNQGCLEGAVSAKTVMLLLAALAKKSGEAKPQELCNALLGVGYLSNQGCLEGAISAKTVMFLLAALAKKSGEAKPQELCNALLGVSFIFPDAAEQEIELLPIISELYANDLPDNSITGLYGLMRCISQHRVVANEFLSKCFDKLLASTDRYLGEQITRKIPPDRSTLNLLATSLSFYQAQWKKEFNLTKPLQDLILASKKPNSSQLHKNINEVIKAALPNFIMMQVEYRVGGFFIDTALIGDNIKLAVEIDGPQHAGEDALLRDYLLTLHGFKIVRISHNDWNNKTIADQHALINERIIQVLSTAQRHDQQPKMSLRADNQVAPLLVPNAVAAPVASNRKRKPKKKKAVSSLLPSSLVETVEGEPRQQPLRFFDKPDSPKLEKKQSKSCSCCEYIAGMIRSVY